MLIGGYPPQAIPEMAAQSASAPQPAVGTQAETDMLDWLDACEDGMPFWMLYDLRGVYVAAFVSLSDDNPKSPISGMRRDFNFKLEQEL